MKGQHHIVTTERTPTGEPRVDLPSPIGDTIACPFGHLKIIATGGDYDSILVANGPTDERDIAYDERAVYIKVFGVEYRIDCRLSRWSDGAWHLGLEHDRTSQWHAVSGYRRDTIGTHLTDSARQAIINWIEPAVNAWCEHHHNTLHAAKMITVNNRITAIQQQIVTNMALLDSLREQADEQIRIEAALMKEPLTT